MTFQAQDLGLDADQLTPADGWHCSHFFYKFDRTRLRALAPDELESGKVAFSQVLSPSNLNAPVRLQTAISSGHKSDFALMMMDPDPLKIQAVHQQLLASPLGTAIEATWSYVSLTEISEYVQSIEQYRDRLRLAGEDQGTIDKKAAAYQGRLGKMNRLSRDLFLPDEQVALSRCELVHAFVFAAEQTDVRTRTQRHQVRWKGFAVDFRWSRPR